MTVVSQVKEWADAPEDSDEEHEHTLKNSVATAFQNRERRLSVAEEVLKAALPIGDTEVPVLAELKEWEQAEDSEAEDTAQELEQQATASFVAREKRLSVALEALKLEVPLGDKEVPVLAHDTDWTQDADSDEDTGEQHLEEQASASFAARERRLTVAMNVLNQEMPLGDVEVVVVPESKEWKEASDSDEETTDFEKQATTHFEARERRLTVALAALKNEVPLADKEVPLHLQDNEWKQAEDLDDDASPQQLESHAAEVYAARERRLSISAMALQQEKIIGDTDIPVVFQAKEWEQTDDVDDETNELNLQQVASSSYANRERRLSLAAEVLKQETPLGDQEVPVLVQASEWDQQGESDEEDVEETFERHAATSYAARERRLTVASEALQQDIPIGDVEVEVVPQAKEWKLDQESDDEQSPRHFEKQATASFDARERRLSVAAETLKQESPPAEKEVAELTEQKTSAEATISDVAEGSAPAVEPATASFESRGRGLTLASGVLGQAQLQNESDADRFSAAFEQERERVPALLQTHPNGTNDRCLQRCSDSCTIH